jgi:hypothetical protein
MMIDPPFRIIGSAFCTVKSVPRVFRAIFGLRALICSKLDDSLLKKLVLVSVTYAVASWVMALIGIHLLHLSVKGQW